jgi:hypothetical protein
MLKRVAALEEMLANLPPPPRPLDDNEIEELREELARLKALPVIPKKPFIESPLGKFAEKILTSLATSQATEAATAVGNQYWETFGGQLKEAIKAFAEWIASLPT